MRAMARYAHKLTASRRAMTEADIAPMYEAGLSDMKVADVKWTCGSLNMRNRLAQGLGIEKGAGPPKLPVQ